MIFYILFFYYVILFFIYNKNILWKLKILKKHSKHHSLNHMKKMINLMTRDKNKLSFVKSHNETMKKIGK
jgi:hypothetical protein